MLKLRYSQKIGILISVITSLFVLVIFSTYSYVFTKSSKIQARSKMLYEVNEVINNFVRFENNKLVIISDTGEIIKDLDRDRLSLAIYNQDLTILQSFGIFNTNTNTLIFKNNEYLKKLEEVLVSKSLRYFHLKSKSNNRSYELLIAPILYENKVVGLISLISPYEQIEWMTNFSNLLIISFLPLVFITSYIIGSRISKKAYEPIIQIIDKIKNSRADKLLGDVSLEGNTQDEAYILALEYNKLIERIKDSVTKQNLFISNASHELRTPLARLQSYVDLIEDKEISNNLTEQIRILSDKLDVLTKLAKLDKVSDRKSSYEDIKNVINRLQDKYSKNLSRLKFEIEDGSELSISSGHLFIILDNTISNSLKYSNDIVNVIIKNEVIKVIDKGIGISKNDLKYITQPFYRSKNVQNIDGNGLGLKLVKDIVEQNNGNIKIKSKLGEGTCVVIKTKSGAI